MKHLLLFLLLFGTSQVLAAQIITTGTDGNPLSGERQAIPGSLNSVSSPTIKTISGVMTEGETLKITGDAFGGKPQPEPITFTRLESDSTGQVPSGWNGYLNTDSVVTDAMAHSGNKSLDSSAIGKTGDYFPRDTFDIIHGIEAGELLYLSAWLYLDHTGSTATAWNWKGPLLTSNLNPNYWSSNPNNGAFGFAGFFEEGYGWYNTAATIQYYDTTAGTVYNYCTQGNGWKSDSFSFKRWQRIDWIFKASSGPNMADGSVVVNRVGATEKPLEATGCITHGDATDPWRYVNIPQGFTNIGNFGTGTTGSNKLIIEADAQVPITPGMEITHSTAGLIPVGTTVTSYDGARIVTMSANAAKTGKGKVQFGGITPQLNLRMFFDDIYIDRSLARLELGNAASYKDCSHRELQLPTRWKNDEISFTLNQGSLHAGENVYLFVIDSYGNVSDGYGPLVLHGPQKVDSNFWLLVEPAFLGKQDMLHNR